MLIPFLISTWWWTTHVHRGCWVSSNPSRGLIAPTYPINKTSVVSPTNTMNVGWTAPGGIPQLVHQWCPDGRGSARTGPVTCHLVLEVEPLLWKRLEWKSIGMMKFQMHGKTCAKPQPGFMFQCIGFVGKILAGNHGFYHQIDWGFRCNFSHHPILRRF